MSHRRGEWERNVADECRAVRSGVAALDQTSFAKFEVSGPLARAALDYLCTNALPEEGHISLTPMCTPTGGIACDVSVSCLAPERFYVVSAAAAETHDAVWIESHLPVRGVEVRNVTEKVGVITLSGPSSLEVLRALP